MENIPDPFREKRNQNGVLKCEFQGESVPMILRHEDVRKAAKDWKTFSSDAPFRVPIPSEEDVRTMRQLPVETDPPDHTDYRKIVEPFFLRAKDPGVIAQVEALMDGMLRDLGPKDPMERMLAEQIVVAHHLVGRAHGGEPSTGSGGKLEF